MDAADRLILRLFQELRESLEPNAREYLESAFGLEKALMDSALIEAWERLFRLLLRHREPQVGHTFQRLTHTAAVFLRRSQERSERLSEEEDLAEIRLKVESVVASLGEVPRFILRSLYSGYRPEQIARYLGITPEELTQHCEPIVDLIRDINRTDHDPI